ncbi:hypothetical protein ACYSNR_00995 [Enterococcus sp. LJL128]
MDLKIIDEINDYELLGDIKKNFFAVKTLDSKIPAIHLIVEDSTYSIVIESKDWGTLKTKDIQNVVKRYNAAEQAARKIQDYLQSEHGLNFI